MEKMKVGIVGCGNISGIYFKNLCTVFSNVEVAACADLEADRAQAKATEYPGVRVCTLEEMLADPEIKLIVNLTTPQGHYPVSMQAVAAGKHVYSEKPLTLTRAEGKELLAAAEKAGVLVGNAPDTFLGAGIQTCRRLMDEGLIGTPVAAQAFMLCPGHEGWHPDPEFYYKKGGGPMFDMGPYYLTALVSLLGPVKRVTGSARISFPQRTIGSEKKRGQIIDVEVPTHVTGIMDFASGAIGTIVTSFDSWGSQTPRIEIFGSKGTLSVPDPNTFGGPVKVKLKGEKEWKELPLTCGFEKNGRGLGPSDMVEAVRAARPHKANGALAYHVLDLMHAFHDASEQGRHIMLESTCERPEPMPEGLFEGTW
ncbi:MAG: Gfo/Idh/MocA family protein [Kiritimatiellia bacterium]